MSGAPMGSPWYGLVVDAVAAVCMGRAGGREGMVGGGGGRAAQEAAQAGGQAGQAAQAGSGHGQAAGAGQTRPEMQRPTPQVVG